jgi:hypothetical protein
LHTKAVDSQADATFGCVHPVPVSTLFKRLRQERQRQGVDAGHGPRTARTLPVRHPGDPSGNGGFHLSGSMPADQYVAERHPAAWVHSPIAGRQGSAQVVPPDDRPAEVARS